MIRRFDGFGGGSAGGLGGCSEGTGGTGSPAEEKPHSEPESISAKSESRLTL